MKKFTMFACLVMVMVFALASYADELPRFTKGVSMLHGGSATSVKAGGDTINVMAASDDPTNTVGEPAYIGDFESGQFALWTSEDLTQPTSSHYQVSDYQQTGGNLAAWCGDITIPSCDDSLDAEGGYGNNWHDMIDFLATVGNTGVSTTVNISALIQNDSEPGYDATYMSYQYEGQTVADIASWDGKWTETKVGSVTYSPVEYIGGTDVRIIFRFKSDGGWSDGDCAWPTAGAHQIDDIVVDVVNDGTTDTYTEDFEGGDLNLGDGLGDRGSYLWAIAFPDGVGDYAQIWEGLEDVDPCHTNYTKQVAFIDDGIIVPGTGGSDCINWCYGPSGYIVTSTGGLAGPSEHINNVVNSEVMAWPNAAYDGIRYEFEIYRHEDLTADAPGMFYTWGVRSADTDSGQVIEDQPFLDRNFVYYGGPDYIVVSNEVTDLMTPGRDEIQVQAGAYEIGWIWGYTGNDGYPAPYFDNFKVRVYPYNGPGMSSREIDMANDGFPERGSIDFGDLGSHSVRFDMARNISLATHENVDFGDSMVVDVVPVRAGAELFGAPTLHYVLQANPVFTAGMRSAGLPDVGSVAGSPAIGASGIPDPDAWAFDLPDTGFLFPGDVLHYYVSGSDAVGGVDVQTSLMPADTTGFSTDFSNMGYNSTYVIRALPTINDDGFGGYVTPEVIFWNDFANRGGENEWYTALNNAGKILGTDYDIYYTNGPSSGVGNGLGGRAGSDLVLENYADMLYTAGDLGSYTISNVDFANDSGDDVGVLTSWLLQGNKDLFLTGDDLVTDLAVNGGPTTLTFAEDMMGVSYQQQDIRSFIDNQATPVVKAVVGNPVFQNLSSWIAYGGCNGINTFDGVNVGGGAQLLAEFTDPSGATGAYTFSAGTLNMPTAAPTSRVVSLPYDFMFVYTDTGAKAPAPLPARSTMLKDVLAYFGQVFVPGNVTGVTPSAKFAARNYPNPFNPSTKIFYTMPKAGHLTLKVYNVRGQLVKTLIDGQIETSGEITWDGTNNQGGNVSSGVYFYEARTNGEVVVNKMALVK